MDHYELNQQNQQPVHTSQFQYYEYRQQMNRILLSQFEQLKCNFCTQWFSVQTQFAILQKYSLNACQKCLANFQYRIVDPTSFQIYDVVLLKTGIELTNKQYQLSQKFQSLIKMHKDNFNLNEQNCSKLKDQDLRNCDLKAQVDIHTQPIKERISEICRNFLDGMIQSWNSILSEIQKGSLEFDCHKEKLIEILSNRYYDFIDDPKKLLSDQRAFHHSNRLRQVSDQIKKITAQKMINKIKAFMTDFLNTNFQNQSQNQSLLTQNKQNKTPNDKRHLRSIREKLMKISRNYQNNQNQLKIQDSNIKTLRKDLNKSSQKSLLRPEIPPLLLKKQKSDKSLTTKTPRSNRADYQSSSEKPHLIIDEYRDKMSRLLKQKSQFQSYMPIQPPKCEQFVNRTYGQKCMVEYLVQLKMKTSLNDNLCQLINQNLSKGNLTCYLKSLDWRQSISMIRFVKVKMHDAQFDTFLNWLKYKNGVQILVLSNNFLTELSLQALYAFCLKHSQSNLRQVYLGNNYIKPSRARKAVEGLKNLNIEVHI